MSLRTQTLKRETVVKALGSAKEGKAYRKGVRICLERARLVTEAYKETEGEPIVIRRAKALKKILEKMTIYIKDNELIVGNFASTPESLPTYPELYWRWLEKAIDSEPIYKDMLTENEKKELKELNKYWQDKSLHGMERKYLPADISHRPYQMGAGIWIWNWEIGTPDYEKLFRVGLKGIIKEAEEKLAHLQKDKSMNAIEYIEKKDFLEAVIIVLNAAINWSKRYSKLASQLAANMKDLNRKKELEEIANICNNVVEKPPKTLHEVLQSFLFIHLIVNFIEHPQIGCGARLDKIMYPFYKADLDKGIMTYEYAQELIEALFVKFHETGFLQPPLWLPGGGGGLGWQTITIGGIDKNDNVVANEMSYIILDAMKEIQTIAPPIALRYHENTPDALIHKAINVIASGVTEPAFFNDKVNITRLINLGIPEEDAKEYSINNCMYPTIPGKNIVHRGITAGVIVLPLCLNLALNQGVLFGRKIGVDTPELSSFKSIDDIMDAFIAQYNHTCRNLTYICNIADALCAKYMPRPFLSAVLDGCIERAEDIRKWTYWPYNHLGAYGANNVADALAAIKKLVFEEKKLTLQELVEAVNNNYAGKKGEEIRLMLLTGAPKFGNDDDYVDELAREIQYRIAKETTKFKDIYGAPYYLDGTAATAPIGIGMRSPATPDGRYALEPFHDGTISPVQGCDRKGPTATLKSVSKVNPLQSMNHLLNQKFQLQFLKGENKEKFISFLKTWYRLGIHHIQFNAVDRQTLIDAQNNPEKYSNLIVRVCGYSAYFIDLNKGMQDEIIHRTEQCF